MCHRADCDSIDYGSDTDIRTDSYPLLYVASFQGFGLAFRLEQVE